MKKILFNLLFALIFIFSLQNINADVYEINNFKEATIDSNGNLQTTSTPISSVNIIGFICDNPSCSSVSGTLWNGQALTSSGSQITLIYPQNIPAGKAGYGIYMYKQGYILWELFTNYEGSGTVGPYNNYLSKKQSCSSTINNVSYSNGNIDVSIKAPLGLVGDLAYIPPQLLSQYSTDVNVDLKITNSNGTISTSSKTTLIQDLTDKTVSFSSSLNPGSYTILASTSVPDAVCLSSVSDSEQININVLFPDNDNDGYLSNVDCNDNDKTVWQILTGYADNDLDSYTSGGVQNLCTGDALPSGYINTQKSEDCNDNNANIYPGATEILGDGVDNDCDGQIDEGDFDITKVIASANPIKGFIPLQVQFTCQGSGGNPPLSYYWNFGDLISSILQNPIHTYSTAGNYTASCNVSDSDTDSMSNSVNIEAIQDVLDIVDLTCFDKVVENHNQACSVSVENILNLPATNANVDVFYSDGSLFGSCVTDNITGKCSVKDMQTITGNFSVYSTTSKTNSIPDNSKSLIFNYTVLREDYLIEGLKVYSNNLFNSEKYDFFRGEKIYVSFNVTKSGLPVTGIVTKATLVSPTGGRIDLNKISESNGEYFYYVQIPLTHDFLGLSDVYTFAFDLANNSGGQEEVTLTIKNNKPHILAIINQTVGVNETIVLNLSAYENDLEDSGDDLRWEASQLGNSTSIDFSITGKIITIKGLSRGIATINLKLFDLNNDFDEQNISVFVKTKAKKNDDKTGGTSSYSGCNPSWECSGWSDCTDGAKTRSYTDLNLCEEGFSKPAEILSCESSDQENILKIDLTGEKQESKTSGKIKFLIWLLILLIILIVLVIRLIRK